MIYLDFETRSRIDLKKLGATRYAWDASTAVLCMCWAFDQDPVVDLWHRRHEDKGVCWAEKSPRPDELIERIKSGEPVEAHNAKFEFNIWNFVLTREFPEFDVQLQMEQMRCSAAKASCLSLPRALGDAANAIQLTERKDTDGQRLINKLSKPIKPRQKKGQPVSTEITWCEEQIEHERNWDYCKQDVRTERALSNFCTEMTKSELEYWFMDFRMNQRGVNLDQRAAKDAIELCRREVERLDGEMFDLTGGRVPGGSKRIAFKTWANEQVVALNNAGCKMEPIENTKADTLSFALYGVPTKAADEAKVARKPEMDKLWDQRGAIGATLKKAMEICLEVNRSSVAKFKTMNAAVCSVENVGEVLADGRLHDIMLYNGADRTGRWSGQGVQPHNFVRGYSKDMVSVWETLLTLDELGDHDLDAITLIEGAPLPVLAKACRGALIASDGMELYAADFKAIEARKLAWMAGCASQLNLFRTGGDPYVAMASAIYNLPVDMLDKAAVKAFAKAHPTERQLGKKAVLGLGYNMGWEKFQATVWAEEGIWLDDNFCKKVVNVYRKTQCPEMPVLWKAIEHAAISAVQNPGQEFWAGGCGSGGNIVTLDASEIAQAREIAETQVGRRSTHGRISDHGGGDSGRTTERRRKDGFTGYEAEIAVAKYLGRKWTPGGVPISSGDVDHVIEVRGTQYASGHLLVYETDAGNAPIVLAVGTAPTYRIAGYIRARDAKRKEWWVQDCETPCYWVPQSALKPLKSKVGHTPGAVAYFVKDRFLHCRLPSGRLLAYLDPEVHEKVNYRYAAKNERGTPCLVTFQSKIGVPMSRVKHHAEQVAERQRKTLSGDPPESFLSPHLSFMGRHIITKEWKRLGTHGGSLTENADQASSRDLLAEAMYRVDRDERFALLLSIHDEVIAEAPIGTMTVSEFEAIMCEVPIWATGMPIDAEGWKGPRLRK